MRRIVYSIGEGLLVIALFTAALSAQNAATVVRAGTTVAALLRMQSEGLNSSFPERQNSKTGSLPM